MQIGREYFLRIILPRHGLVQINSSFLFLELYIFFTGSSFNINTLFFQKTFFWGGFGTAWKRSPSGCVFRSGCTWPRDGLFSAFVTIKPFVCVDSRRARLFSSMRASLLVEEWCGYQHNGIVGQLYNPVGADKKWNLKPARQTGW